MVNTGMIKCDRCGKLGSPRINALGNRYYDEFCEEGTPVYISQLDYSGQLCGECINDLGAKQVEDYFAKVRKY